MTTAFFFWYFDQEPVLIYKESIYARVFKKVDISEIYINIYIPFVLFRAEKQKIYIYFEISTFLKTSVYIYTATSRKVVW